MNLHEGIALLDVGFGYNVYVQILQRLGNQSVLGFFV